MENAYDNVFFKYLIRQCKNPTGMLGSMMTGIWNNTFRNMTHWGFQPIEFHSTDNILDIGCGGGATINELAKLVTGNGKIYGIDISDTAVKNAKKINKNYIKQQKVKILQSSAEHIPFQNTTFDKVFAFQTHIYWNSIFQSLKEVYRILKPNATFYIICEKEKIYYHLHEYASTANMIDLLRNTGFTNISFRENANWIEYMGDK